MRRPKQQSAAKMKVYPDSCIYGRQGDDQTQPDIEKDTFAIAAIFDICRIAGHKIIGSIHIESEINANPNQKRKLATMAFFTNTVKPENIVAMTPADFNRARVFIAQGLRVADSYHLAIAESSGAEVLLTVDKDFIRIATDKKLSKVRVLNPSNFLKEIAL